MPKRSGIVWTVAVIAVAFVVGSAFAQDAADGVYKSTKGYTITAPTGWQTVSGELEEAELNKLPQHVREAYDPNTADVMFMDLAGKDEDFKDNLNIVVLDEVVPIEASFVGELKTILTDQYTNLFENFEMKSFEEKEFAGKKAIRIEATYTLLGYNLHLYQALLAGPSKTLVMTCTMDQTRKDDRITLCTNAFNSVAFQ